MRIGYMLVKPGLVMAWIGQVCVGYVWIGQFWTS